MVLSGIAREGIDSDAARWEALTTILRPWAERGYRLAAAQLGDRSAAEDVVQDALLKSWQGYDRLRDKDKVGPWFLKIVINECRRSNRRLRRLLDFAMADGTREGPERQVIEDQDLRRALGRLTPDQRLVILTHFYLDMTLVETAEVLGTPLGTVKSRLDRGLSRMRDHLETRA